MAEETLLTASRRMVRFLDIDLHGGGIVTQQTQEAHETLRKMVTKEAEREKRDEERTKAAANLINNVHPIDKERGK